MRRRATAETRDTEMILIKQHNSHHVARLYMHLFCMAVDNFFYGKQLFPYLDYDLSTRVIRGIIYVRINLYTAEAKELHKELAELRVPLDDASRTMAILQIAVDKQQVFGIVGDAEPNFEALNEELSTLDDRPWQDIDSFDLIDPQDNQLVRGAFYPLAEKRELATQEVNIASSLDESFADTHGELLPLFWHLAMVTSESIGRELYKNAGLYGVATSHEPENRVTTLVRHYRAAPEVAQKLNDIRDLVDGVILDLDDSDAYRRMTTELESVSRSATGRILPDPIALYDRTGIILGIKGWKRIATGENCDLILSNMKVSVSAGSERASIDVKELLNL
jgi:hypothetical protein